VEETTQGEQGRTNASSACLKGRCKALCGDSVSSSHIKENKLGREGKEGEPEERKRARKYENKKWGKRENRVRNKEWLNKVDGEEVKKDGGTYLRRRNGEIGG